jgi:hypothetical protein
MRFFADENLEQPIIERLFRAGYDVATVPVGQEGTADPVVLAVSAGLGTAVELPLRPGAPGYRAFPAFSLTYPSFESFQKTSSASSCGMGMIFKIDWMS